MKVLISSDGYTAHYFIRLGVARVLTMMGHNVVMWDIHKKPAFDAFDEFEPDLFIGQTFNVNKALIKCIDQRPHLRVIMKASDYGPAAEEMDLNTFPVLTARTDEIDKMKELYDKTGKPDFVLIHYHPDYVDKTHSYWKERLGIPYHSILSAADIIEYTGGKYKAEYDTDLAFVGGYWPYKSRTLDDYILRLCEPGKNFRIKIFGNQPWPVSQYCGNIDSTEVKHALKSAKICPNIHELHSQVFGWDVVERPFKLLSNKCFVISDYVEGLEKLYKDEIVFARSPGEFEDKVRYFIRNPSEREKYIEKGFKKTIKEHTYFNRVHQIMGLLGLESQQELCLKTRTHALKQLGIEDESV